METRYDEIGVNQNICMQSLNFKSTLLLSVVISFCVCNTVIQIFQTEINGTFLGAFAKLRKATISFVMSVRLSVCPHGTSRLPLDGFSRNLILQYSSKIIRENSSFIKIVQKYHYTFLIIYGPFLLRMRNCRENKNTHFVLSNSFSSFENRSVYEIAWKNIVERDRPRMTIWCMRIAC